MPDRGGWFGIFNFSICKFFLGSIACLSTHSDETQHPPTAAHSIFSAKHSASKNRIHVVHIAMPAVFVFGLLAMIATPLVAQDATGGGPAASVNPLIDTGRGPGGGINLFPGATLPFGMVQLSPDTESKGYGYHYDQDTIQGFSMTHMSGVGCSNDGEVFFTPTTGPVLTEVSDFQSPYSHDHESAAPGYYQVDLSRWGVNAELTATDHTGVAQFTFPAGKPANILIPISHTLNHTVSAYVRLVGDHQVDGYVVNQLFCGKKDTYKVYFVMTFNRPFAKFGTWSGDQYGGPGTVAAGNREATQTSHDQWIGAYATWPSADHSQTITAKIAISYVDPAGAENNLKVEAAGKSFSEVRHQDYATWNKMLSVIDITGGSPANGRFSTPRSITAY